SGFTPTARVDIDGPVLLFAIAVSVLTAMLAGLIPAFSGARADAQAPLKSAIGQIAGRHRRFGARDAFVVAEIALATALLFGAGGRGGRRGALPAVDPGFETTSLLTMRMQLPAAKYEPAARVRFFRDVEARVSQLPGVRAAGVIAFLPLSGSSARTTATIVG